jgi:hypothetical protein
LFKDTCHICEPETPCLVAYKAPPETNNKIGFGKVADTSTVDASK